MTNHYLRDDRDAEILEHEKEMQEMLKQEEQVEIGVTKNKYIPEQFEIRMMSPHIKSSSESYYFGFHSFAHADSRTVAIDMHYKALKRLTATLLRTIANKEKMDNKTPWGEEILSMIELSRSLADELEKKHG